MNLEQHLLRHMAFSHTTFGKSRRTAGVIDHIRKELVEVEDSDGSPEEWVDVVMLALDGLARELAFSKADLREYGIFNKKPKRNDPEEVAKAVVSLILKKQAINEARDWPDWRTADVTKAIEHVRPK